MIPPKNSTTKWIKTVQDDREIEILIDYETMPQGFHLSELKYDAWGKYLDIGTPESQKLDLAKLLIYKRYYLKYTIKDWKGIDEKCVLIDKSGGTELDDELWWRLVRSESKTTALFDLISSELELTENDKKKSQSVNTSQTKD